MSKYLTKFATNEAYNEAVEAQTLNCPNVSLIAEDNSVKFLKSNPDIGVGIKSADGGYYTLAEWNALDTKPTAVGVYVKQGTEVGFVIHGTINTSVKWSSNTSVTVSGVTTRTSQANALLDYKGKDNTDAVLNAVTLGTIADAPLFTWARGLSFADGSEGYVPSMGELALIKDNLAQINGCRTALGQTEIVFASKNLWTSTQYSAYGAWVWGSSRWDGYGKSYSSYGLALCAL